MAAIIIDARKPSISSTNALARRQGAISRTPSRISARLESNPTSSG
jgi:hypothetical protein